MTFTVTLPLPPSTNNLYVNVGKGRKPSKEYAAWTKQAILETYAQVPAASRVEGIPSIVIQVPAAMPGDIDNRIKAILDCLVKARRIDDDKYIWSITITRCNLLHDGARVTVESAA